MKYKIAADSSCCAKIFEINDLVMVHLRKGRFPAGKYSKLQKHNFGPCQILKRINLNAYVIDLPEEFQMLATFNVVDLQPIFHLMPTAQVGYATCRACLSRQTMVLVVLTTPSAWNDPINNGGIRHSSSALFESNNNLVCYFFLGGFPSLPSVDSNSDLSLLVSQVRLSFRLVVIGLCSSFVLPLHSWIFYSLVFPSVEYSSIAVFYFGRSSFHCPLSLRLVISF